MSQPRGQEFRQITAACMQEDKVSIIPVPLSQVTKQLEGYKERREQRKKK